ncbi:MepB family protein [Paenarthrobacter aurescens]|uniref:MepB protein n=1 Tax=Paenarthrobacter aurescens TaxID=43663 RepID=A0A4Y3NCX0_PAEAU|nr:MepB family protein [Paenarthrobacter aurescens]MDO6141875.1 MepB family protein [Paenarthrobacter aurescens]MDO6145680.1 MepB family protein [Paenarthrobacter aurescens]MDO6156924.1 MepB family protein [Paenarthrobacter aurescens]MDO6160910.1 MepB family protein [Paenarthrobacter aurescens]GEB19083.1 hypothetical protein AAU01_18380 [Paenarthrobacter aurescens]
MPAPEIHPDVAEAFQALVPPSGRRSKPVPEAENHDYGAAVARNGQQLLRFRVAKVTPTKVGLFVAVWRRAEDGTTEPFPAGDDADLLVIAVREGTRTGHFAFPTTALVKHGIVSVDGTGGKRGFRVYPPWAEVSSRQAARTRQWQGAYFTEGGTRPDNAK